MIVYHFAGFIVEPAQIFFFLVPKLPK